MLVKFWKVILGPTYLAWFKTLLNSSQAHKIITTLSTLITQCQTRSEHQQLDFARTVFSVTLRATFVIAKTLYDGYTFEGVAGGRSKSVPSQGSEPG